MSKHSKIEWTDHTFNPWSGCVKVSPACKHCYAAALPPAYRRNAVWGAHTDRMPASDSYWAQPLAWDRKARKAGVRARVFCASTADVFEDRADLDPLRKRLWGLIKQTPDLDWLLLTKRPDVMFKWSQSHSWPVNAWAGTTVESQEWADRRIPWLLKVPAQIRFLSCEPLLGALRLFCDQDATDPRVAVGNEITTHATGKEPTDDHDISVEPGIHWVIVGGESGTNARPSHPDWFRSLRDQCREAGVPFLFKQWGEWEPQSFSLAFYRSASENMNDRPQVQFVGSDGATSWADRASMPNACPVAKVGKSAAGRLLDGIEHNEFPRAGQL